MMRVLRMAWPYLAAIALLLGMQQCYAWRIRAAEGRGYAVAQEEARVVMSGYVMAVKPLLAKRDSAIAKTDTAAAKVTDAAAQYRKKRALLPAALPPVVADAIAAADSLVAALPPLVAAVQTERVATREVHIIDTTMVHALSTDNARLTRRVTQLEKRPTWTKLGVITAVVGTITYFVGVR